MDLIYSFDSNRFQLGTLCKHEHRWPGTNQSLRLAIIDSTVKHDCRRPDGVRIGNCKGCAGRKQSDWLISFIDAQAMGLPDGFKFGKPCKAGHLWNGHKMTLRDRHGKCPDCEKARQQSDTYKQQRKLYVSNTVEKRSKHYQAYYNAKKENHKEWLQYLERRKHYKRANYASRLAQPCATKAQGLEGLVLPPGVRLNRCTAVIVRKLLAAGQPADWAHLAPLIPEARQEQAFQQALRPGRRCPSVARLVMNEQRRYWRENPEGKREHDKQWAQARWWLEYQTRPELRLYIRQKSKRRKAQMRDSVAIQLSGKQVRARFAQFNHCCAYCGAGRELHIEHVVPISKGGTHALGNVVPACESCNYSKTTHEVESWYRSQPFFSETRWRKIKRVLNWNRSGVGQLALL